jgi:hypothetical protein
MPEMPSGSPDSLRATMRSTPRSPRTPGSWDRVAAMLAAFIQLLAAEKSAAEEGRDVILAMLIVGLIFVVVAVGGDLLAKVFKKH